MSAPESRLDGLPLILYDDCVRRALLEDLGRAGDLTTDSIVDAGSEATGLVVVREPGRIAGLEVAIHAFRTLDPNLRAHASVSDGDDVPAGTGLVRLWGRSRALLSAERTALNFLGRMCGIATATKAFVEAVAHTSARIVCTRKTTPGLRILEKYAVRAGGGSNHRFGLDDAVLVKDNHIAVAGGIPEAVRRARRRAGHMVRVEVEVDTLVQLREALMTGIDAVLLDNFSLEDLREGVSMAKGRALVEASGGVTPATVAAVAETGVDLISIGWITHSAPALDVALDL